MSKTKVIVFIIIALILVAGIVYFFSASSKPAVSNSNPESQNTNPSESGQNPSSNTAQEQTPPSQSQQKTYEIQIKSFAFNPGTLTINKGDSIVWTNTDSASHTIISDSGSEVSSQSLSTGQSYSHTFNTAGTYAYHCSVHPSMKASIIVK